MSNLSNCFSYLGINFYEKDIPEKIPKNFNLFIKFIHALNFSYQQHFTRNLALLHNSQKFCQQVPSLDKIFNIFENNFIKKAVNSKCLFIKNWNEEMIYLLVWLISVSEILFYKSFYEFTSKEWQILSNLLPKSDAESLKYKWFTLISSIRSPEWEKDEDDKLLEILREHDSHLFAPNYNGSIDIKWSKVALDLSKRANPGTSFKTSKQCRERWLNHLNPFLNKESWSHEDDIRLLEESIAKKKSWSEISKIFCGRTQHTVKNRFLAVMGKELMLSRTAIRNLLKKTNNEQLITDVLNKMRATLQPNVLNKTLLTKRSFEKIFFESPMLRKKIKPEEEPMMSSSLMTGTGMNINEGSLNFENKENNGGLDDILAEKFNWKEFIEEPENKEKEEPENFTMNHATNNGVFNVDDFFSL